MALYANVVLFLFVIRGVASLTCSSCSGIKSLSICQNNITCSDYQSCFTRSDTSTENTTFTMGCTNNENCGSIPTYDRVSSQSMRKNCTECCGTDQCNKLLCKHQDPFPCEDAPGADCAYWNQNFDICVKIHKAKNMCRSFCKLCDLVDGNWAEWTAWSSCDVTCGQGKHVRTRTCTDPAPYYMGLDCEGPKTDTKVCVRQLCPVHGGWTDWSSWGSCPVTCGMGIQKRYRKCTNPFPKRYGDHCFGDSIDDKICTNGPCPGTDGGWSEWGEWNNCSASCDTGLRKRSRSCTNPLPDHHGNYCDGDASEVELCKGIQCAKNDPVAFSAYYVTDKSPIIAQTMIFSTILLNEGDAYSNLTGVFVAPRNGTYIFNAQLCISSGRNLHFDIMVGNVAYSTTYGYAYNSCECPTGHVVVQLKTNNTVYVQWKTFSYTKYNVFCQGSYFRNSFSGSIINESN